jgi:glycine cleavage system aminomethyltransferase T
MLPGLAPREHCHLPTVLLHQCRLCIWASLALAKQLVWGLVAQVTLLDVSNRTVMFSLLGPESDAILLDLKADHIVGQPYGSHTLLEFQHTPVIVAVGSGLAAPGYTLICGEACAADLWQSILAQVIRLVMGCGLLPARHATARRH